MYYPSNACRSHTKQNKHIYIYIYIYLSVYLFRARLSLSPFSPQILCLGGGRPPFGYVSLETRRDPRHLPPPRPLVHLVLEPHLRASQHFPAADQILQPAGDCAAAALPDASAPVHQRVVQRLSMDGLLQAAPQLDGLWAQECDAGDYRVPAALLPGVDRQPPIERKHTGIFRRMAGGAGPEVVEKRREEEEEEMMMMASITIPMMTLSMTIAMVASITMTMMMVAITMTMMMTPSITMTMMMTPSITMAMMMTPSITMTMMMTLSITMTMMMTLSITIPMTLTIPLSPPLLDSFSFPSLPQLDRQGEALQAEAPVAGPPALQQACGAAQASASLVTRL